MECLACIVIPYFISFSQVLHCPQVDMKLPLKTNNSEDKGKSVQSLSRVRLFATPWTAARQASPSRTNSWSLPKLMSNESVHPSMPFNHLILCRPLLLLPSIFPSIRVFSNESVLHIRWPKYGVSASASVLPLNIQD